MYRELKFAVAAPACETALQILLAQFRGSDPFPEGVVDSVYFDTDRLDAYALCREKAPLTLKFRARGYSEGCYTQLQIKSKNRGVVSKAKCGITPRVGLPPDVSWAELLEHSSPEAQRVAASSAPWGLLRPCLRVRYRRWRFRVQDDRVTFDTDIRFEGVAVTHTGLRLSAGMMESVLEIKTFRASPQIPLLGLMALAPAPMSKYREGIVRLGIAVNGVASGYHEPALLSEWYARPKLV